MERTEEEILERWVVIGGIENVAEILRKKRRERLMDKSFCETKPCQWMCVRVVTRLELLMSPQGGYTVRRHTPVTPNTSPLAHCDWLRESG